MPKNSKGIEVAEIIKDRCMACQICIGECPVEAIELTREGVAEIDPEVCVGCGKCADVCPVEAVAFDRSKRRSVKPKRKKPRPRTEYVAVYIEQKDDQGADVAWELVGKARELAAKLQARVIGLVPGSGLDKVLNDAGAYGCDEVHCLEHECLASYVSFTYGHALTHLVTEIRPDILLVGATSQGRDLAGIVATHLKTGLTADCTGLDIEEETGLLLMTRPTFGGNIMATIFCEERRPQMSTVRPKVMPPPPREEGRDFSLVRHEWEPPKGKYPSIVEYIEDVSRLGMDITQYPVLVVAGRGACDPGSYPLLEELAGLLGGAVACSRPVVESGFMPYERQVGQTGKTVAPKLYIGIGVSGAIQHRVAIQGASRIMAVNTDSSAPIFQIADVGIVGDYTRVLPELISQIKQRMNVNA
ncbi:MAG: electron transfer flavoprotein subunit alpha [Desulfohalobiaceae bacterium]|nr:electron transfer flavoprotein subunit alpha [Desulfohalobiaceae bacterium]